MYDQQQHTDFQNFLALTASTAYVEEHTDGHEIMSKDAWKRISKHVRFVPGDRVLDIGCGTGPGIRIFEPLADVLGITCLPKEAEIINIHHPGRATVMDMHNIGVFENLFHLVWCRHALEHSPSVPFMLYLIRKALKSHGFAYIEVPGYRTSSDHESNPNHHTIVPIYSWRVLIERAGFKIVDSWKFDFETKSGEDVYYCFLAAN